MPQKIYQVDAFTSEPFKGNPAAVCIMPEPAQEEWMKNVARETNLSETAFLYPKDKGYHLRWFTPAMEVELCGHATLASAHILWETGDLKPDQPALFSTRSGLLTARRKGDLIELDFPALASHEVQVPDTIIKGLGVTPLHSWRNRFNYLIEIATEDILRSLQPDFSLLEKINAYGVIVTSSSATGEFDFVSRFFAPSRGVKEDPVTGSAHCALGPFWSNRLQKDVMTAYQASERGGVVHVRMNGDRVLLGGHAVTVLRGELV